jgi:hypothetical protein
MKLRTIFKTLLIGVSYYSFKKVIDTFPDPYRRIVVLSVRVCVFLLLFLSIFAFLSGRIYSISSNVSTPILLRNIFIGICLFIACVVSFFLTAVCEEIYRKLSEIERKTAQKIDDARGSFNEPIEKVKESIALSKRGIVKTCKLAGTTSKYIYAASLRLTSIGMDSAAKTFFKVFRKNIPAKKNITEENSKKNLEEGLK